MRLSHHRRGDGEPLVLLHGLGMEWQAWGALLPALAARREVIALDLPGFGDSLPLAGTAPTVPKLADAVERFLEELALERPHLAGLSLGGALTLELARRRLARSACALAPLGFGRGLERAWARAVLAGTRLSTRALGPAGPLTVGGPRRRRAALWHVVGRPERIDPALAVRGARAYVRCPGFWPTLRATLGWDATAGGPPPCPTTVVWGDRDRILLSRPQSARARAALPGARHVVVAGAGHVIPWDEPGETARLILEAGTSG